MNGYIHLYTGNGKGKTTAAFGLALRAIGAGNRVFVAQFVKGMPYSEIDAARTFLPGIEIRQYGEGCFIYTTPTDTDVAVARAGLAEVARVITEARYDMVILDEACIAIHFNLFSARELIDILTTKPPATEIIITGRYAPPELIEFADLVTDMQDVKHYYTRGILARKGIEF